ncbi:MAG: hypothetical protein ABIH85_07115 [Candidatus Omnitrophota bacterium]
MFLRRKKIFCLGLSGLILCAGLFFSSIPADALGLSVDPGEIILREVPLGEKISVVEFAGEKAKLLIENKSEKDCTYDIEVLSVTGVNAHLKRGYKDIPGTSWIKPEKKEVHILAGNTKTVDVYLEIPKDKQYENKNYQAILEVKSRKDNPGDLFVLAVQVRMCISTQKIED